MGCSQSKVHPPTRSYETCSGDGKVTPQNTNGRKLSAAQSLVSGSMKKSSNWKPSVQLCKDCRKLTSIDGTLWGELLLAGLSGLLRNKEHCNKINVFPVPDGDTGTNMFLGLRGGVRAYAESRESKLGDMLATFANAMLMSAQGNSGTALSFLFSNLQRAIPSDAESLDLTTFVKALKSVGNRMFECMENPVPGTLLSVIKASTDNLREDVEDVETFLNEWLKHANEDLQKTPEQLVVNGVQILKKSGVVDSGAQGFCFIVEGMFQAITSSDFEYLNYDAKESKDIQVFDQMFQGSQESEHDPATVDLTYQFCTEVFMTMKDGVDVEEIKKKVSPFGNSMAVVSTSSLMKLHIHSNKPEGVFKALTPFSKYGYLEKAKAEDMKMQVADAKFKVPDMNKAKTAIIWTSIASVPTYIEHIASATMVPVRVIVDGEVYADRAEMTEVQAANISRLGNFDEYSTSAPSAGLFEKKIRDIFALNRFDEVLLFLPSVTLSKGSIAMAKLAISLLPEEMQSKVHTIEHPYGFVIGGDQVAMGFELAAQGLSAREIKEKIQDLYLNRPLCYAFVINTIGNLIKTGRLRVEGKNRILLPIVKKFKLKLVGHLPWPFAEAKKYKELRDRMKEENTEELTAPQKSGIKRTWKGVMKGVMKECLKKVPRGTKVDVIVETSECQHHAQYLMKMIQSTYDVRFISYSRMSATLVFASGVPAVNVLVREYREGDPRLGGV